MKINKKIDLGEYIVIINYDNVTGSIEVDVLDELEGLIETITITNSEDDENNDEKIINTNLN